MYQLSPPGESEEISVTISLLKLELALVGGITLQNEQATLRIQVKSMPIYTFGSAIGSS